MTVTTERDGSVAIVTVDRADVRNAVDGPTAAALASAFRDVEAADDVAVAVLCGAGGTFCAGADLKAVAALGDAAAGTANRLDPDGDGPMGPTRLSLSKPVIAAVEGHAVAGGLELALWCDLRVAAETAVFGVYCRRWGVPLVDGGTVRLPRLIGQSRALDMILTGRGVDADEAERMGIVNRLVAPGEARAEAVALAKQLAAFPQRCLRADRASARTQWGLTEADAMRAEFDGGSAVIASGETVAGAARFAGGAGRHGAFEE
jgi:enoyl-CoA hydratase